MARKPKPSSLAKFRADNAKKASEKCWFCRIAETRNAEGMTAREALDEILRMVDAGDRFWSVNEARGYLQQQFGYDGKPGALLHHVRDHIGRAWQPRSLEGK